MIGNTGDFNISKYASDETYSPDVINTFGTSYGNSDGWCEEMRGMGFMPGFRILKMKVRPPLPQQKKALTKSAKAKFKVPKFRTGMLHGHPLLDTMDGVDYTMGFSLSDLTSSISKQVNAELDKAKAAVAAQYEAAKQKEIEKLKATAATQAATLISKAQTEATKAIQTTAPKVGAALNTGIVKAAQSPAASSIVSSGVEAGLEQAKGYLGGLVLRYGPAVVVGGVAALGLGVWYLMRRK